MTNTLIASDYALSDHAEEHLRIEPSLPLPGKLFLGIEDHSLDEDTQGAGRYVHIDADRVRDAIDEAVGPRDPEGHGARLYPARHRDRLLRHIEDLEATLTRRNERHERDQERIRELESLLARQEAEIYDLQQPKTVREYLGLAWEAAIVPEGGTIHAGEEFLCKDENGIRQPALGPASHPISANLLGVERRLLEPRPEPSEEDSYRKELESKGLAEWEIELLVGAAA